MAKDVHAKIILSSLDGTVDNPSISFPFHSDTATDFTNAGAIITALTNFLNTVSTGQTNTLASYISEVLSRTTAASEITLTDITGKLDGSPAGSPADVQNFTLGATTSTTGYPEGVAATIQYRAAYGSDVEFGPGTRPRSRDRNRVYLGPLNFNAFENDSVTHRCKLTPGFITDCLNAMVALNTPHTTGSDTWQLMVWSRVNAGLKLPIIASMDDRPDYQRRRSDPNPTGIITIGL